MEIKTYLFHLLVDFSIGKKGFLGRYAPICPLFEIRTTDDTTHRVYLHTAKRIFQIHPSVGAQIEPQTHRQTHTQTDTQTDTDFLFY